MNVLIAVKGTESEGFYRRLASLIALEHVDAIILAHVIDTRPHEALEAGRRRLLDRRPLSPDRALDLTHAEQERAARILADARSAVESCGFPRDRIQTVQLQGKPNEALREFAERESCVVVVGRRPGEQGPHSIGKTARFLIDHAPIGAILMR